MFYCFIVVICTSCAVRYFVMCWRRCHLCCCRYILFRSFACKAAGKNHIIILKKKQLVPRQTAILARLLIPLFIAIANQKHLMHLDSYNITNNKTTTTKKEKKQHRQLYRVILLDKSTKPSLRSFLFSSLSASCNR